ncbi:uncharacterized protein LOC127737903 [Mytilus californianus]|uniref:uncharacterized protein LOC127737903 n=1 Tax=Mytilus californianus TaxID=6549 RepID=UPI0022469863|nr:uncharacterized protein LOC127737903 [Mytilus californianus]
MNWIPFLVFAIHVVLIAGFVKKCPNREQFDVVAELNCPENLDLFHCLPVLPDYNDVIFICKPPKWFVNGTFAVWSPKYEKITSVPCENNRYQELPYKSNDRFAFKCSMGKNFCTEKGQAKLLHNLKTEDNLCFCSDGYTFLTEPKNGTYCNPDVENCTCIWEGIDQESEITTNVHFLNRKIGELLVNQTDKGKELSKKSEYKFQSIYAVLIAVLVCAILYLSVVIFKIVTARSKDNDKHITLDSVICCKTICPLSFNQRTVTDSEMVTVKSEEEQSFQVSETCCFIMWSISRQKDKKDQHRKYIKSTETHLIDDMIIKPNGTLPINKSVDNTDEILLILGETRKE